MSPEAPTVARGKTLQVQATAIRSDGSREDVTSSGVWDSSDPSVATVSNEPGAAGLVTGRAVGSASVLFAYVDPEDASRQLSAQAVLQVTEAPKGAVVVLPGPIQRTTEAGGAATFTVALSSPPAASVTVGLSSSNPAEGAASPAQLVFTPATWDAPQTVTVTGANDSAADGPQPYRVVFAPAVSADDAFSGVKPEDLTFTNLDDDTAGIAVEPTSGLTTTEAGGTATFAVVLTSEPSADVVIGLSSSLPAEGTVSPATLTFTKSTWSIPQTATITGVPDDAADGPRQYLIVTAPAVSPDPAYSGLDGADVSVANLDAEKACILVDGKNLTTSEFGDTATFTAVLCSRPTAEVVIGLSSSNTDEGTVSPSSLSFTPENWDKPQTITVAGGRDDDVAELSQLYFIVTAPAVSADARYNGLDAADVPVVNFDSDDPGITVVATGGLMTTEAGGTATFAVTLNSKPKADVIVPLTSSDASEGTVSPPSLIFTSQNWNQLHTVTVTGQPDSEADGDMLYTIITGEAVSDDLMYAGLNPPDVLLTNLDARTACIRLDRTAVTTTEFGGSDTFTVVLCSKPAADVTIPLTSTNLGEATVSPTSLTFTSTNWDEPQTVTVTGVNDNEVADGDQHFFIATAPAVSADLRYNGLDAADVAVTNLDGDDPGILVSATTGLKTTEAGGTATFTVVLCSRPTAEVTLRLTSSDPTEGAVSPSSLTFAGDLWSAPQTVTVTGQPDSEVDGDKSFTIITSPLVSEDLRYAWLNPPDVQVTNLDVDAPK